jgi:hypothetical protein
MGAESTSKSMPPFLTLCRILLSFAGPSDGARHPHTPRLPAPSRPASAARALDDRRAGSPRGRLCSHARTLTAAVVTPARIECTMVIRRGQKLARRQGDASRRRSRCRDGWSDKRREQPRSRSRELQRPSPAVGDAHHESATRKGNLDPDPLMEDGSDDRSKYSQRHGRAAALRPSGNDRRPARSVRMRHL